MGRLIDEDIVIDIINFECGKWTGLSKTIEKEIKALPSAQPEKRTEEHTETHACDTISRQGALDGLSKLRPRMIDTYEKDGDPFLKVRACDVNDMLEGLPSAQTEVIRCRDCVRYGEPECLMAYDGKQWAEDDGFCHAGERGEQDEID